MDGRLRVRRDKYVDYVDHVARAWSAVVFMTRCVYDKVAGRATKTVFAIFPSFFIRAIACPSADTPA